MAAAWQASGTLLGSTGADITPVIPAHATNDILFLLAASRVVTETCLTPSGWSFAWGPVDETAWRTYIFWKRAVSAAETNPLCDWSAAVGEKYGQIHTIRGAVTSGSPYSASQPTAGPADPAVSAGITTSEAGQLVCTFGIGADNLATSAVVTGTDPASYTLRHHSVIATGADANGWFYDATRAAPGATGNVSTDFNAAPLHWCTMLAAILGARAPTRSRTMQARKPAGARRAVFT